MIHALGLVLAAGAARVLVQHLDETCEFGRGNDLAQLGGEIDLELLPWRAVDPTARGIGMAVGEGDVGLDVENRRAVAQVRGEHVDHGGAVDDFDAVELHAGQTDGIGPKGAARGKDATTLGAAQAGRAHGGSPLRRGAGLAGSRRIHGDIGRRSTGRAVFELPEQPQMAELL